MPTYILHGVPVEFPYEAYSVQLEYMASVIHALNTNSNGLLESPTGTGKTLCLLCATLAWRRHALLNKPAKEAENTQLNTLSRTSSLMGDGSIGDNNNNNDEDPVQMKTHGKVSAKNILQSFKSRAKDNGNQSPNEQDPTMIDYRIIYCSRTHSQLKQVIRELSNTSYRPKMTFMASRKQLCINQKVNKLPDGQQNTMCRLLSQQRKCSSFVNYEAGGSNKNPLLSSTLKLTLAKKKQADPTSTAATTATSATNDTTKGKDIKSNELFNEYEKETNNSISRNNSSISALSNTTVITTSSTDNEHPILDIEMLHTYGSENDMCPFYMVQDARDSAEIIFAPYNYIIDNQLRVTANINKILPGSIIIIDEAHNTEDVAVSCSSFKVTATLLSGIIEDCNEAVIRLRSQEKSQAQAEAGGGSTIASALAAAASASAAAAAAGESDALQLKHVLQVKSVIFHLEYLLGMFGQRMKRNGIDVITHQHFLSILDGIGIKPVSYESLAQMCRKISDFLTSSTNTSALDSSSSSQQRQNKQGQSSSNLSASTNNIGVWSSQFSTMLLSLFTTADNVSFKVVLEHLTMGGEIIPHTEYAQQYALYKAHLGKLRRAEMEKRSSDNTAVNELTNSITLEIAERMNVSSIITELIHITRLKFKESQAKNGNDNGDDNLTTTNPLGDHGTNATTSSLPETSPINIHYMCVNGGVAISKLMKSKPHSLLLTSGTLSPLESFTNELQVPFNVVLQNKHVIDNNQVLACVLKQGPTGALMDSKFANRNNVQYLNDLGTALVNVARQTPDGMLVFFPSYGAMESTLKHWATSPSNAKGGYVSTYQQRTNRFNNGGNNHNTNNNNNNNNTNNNSYSFQKNKTNQSEYLDDDIQSWFVSAKKPDQNGQPKKINAFSMLGMKSNVSQTSHHRDSNDDNNADSNAGDDEDGITSPKNIDISAFSQPTFATDSLLFRLVAQKPIVVEPRGSQTFPQVMAYYSHLLELGRKDGDIKDGDVDDDGDEFHGWKGRNNSNSISIPGFSSHSSLNTPSKGVIFFGVCRGKASEGYDFKDHAARAVFVTGIPFPNIHEKQIILKKKYMDEQKQSIQFIYSLLKNGKKPNDFSVEERLKYADISSIHPVSNVEDIEENGLLQTINGSEWLNLAAFRAINQAIGRVIRHKNDFGLIILADCRFLEPRNSNLLSSWTQPRIQKCQTFGQLISQTTQFFASMKTKYPAAFQHLEQKNTQSNSISLLSSLNKPTTPIKRPSTPVKLPHTPPTSVKQQKTSTSLSPFTSMGTDYFANGDEYLSLGFSNDTVSFTDTSSSSRGSTSGFSSTTSIPKVKRSTSSTQYNPLNSGNTEAKSTLGVILGSKNEFASKKNPITSIQDIDSDSDSDDDCIIEEVKTSQAPITIQARPQYSQEKSEIHLPPSTTNPLARLNTTGNLNNARNSFYNKSPSTISNISSTSNPLKMLQNGRQSSTNKFNQSSSQMSQSTSVFQPKQNAFASMNQNNKTGAPSKEQGILSMFVKKM